MNSEIYQNFEKVLNEGIPKKIDFLALEKMAKNLVEDDLFQKEITYIFYKLARANNWYKVYLIILIIGYVPYNILTEKISISRVLRSIVDKIDIDHFETREMVTKTLLALLNCANEDKPIDGRILKNILVKIKKCLESEESHSIRSMLEAIQIQTTIFVNINEPLSFEQVNHILIDTLKLPDKIKVEMTDEDRDRTLKKMQLFGLSLPADIGMVRYMEVENVNRSNKITELLAGLYQEDFDKYITAMNNSEQDKEFAFLASEIFAFVDFPNREWGQLVRKGDNSERVFKAYLNLLKQITSNRALCDINKLYYIGMNFAFCPEKLRINIEKFHDELRIISKDTMAKPLLRLAIRKLLIEVEIQQESIDKIINREKQSWSSGDLMDSIMMASENLETGGFVQINYETGQGLAVGNIIADTKGMRVERYAYYAKEDGELGI